MLPFNIYACDLLGLLGCKLEVGRKHVGLVHCCIFRAWDLNSGLAKYNGSVFNHCLLLLQTEFFNLSPLFPERLMSNALDLTKSANLSTQVPPLTQKQGLLARHVRCSAWANCSPKATVLF